MRAAVLVKKDAPLDILDLDVSALLSGQVLVKVLYSGVCRSQLMELRGNRGQDHWIPHLLGHEGSGIVIDKADDVSKVKIDDEVILGWLKADGIDAQPAKYQHGKQLINSGQVTTFSNYSVVSENRLVLKPQGLPFDQAILFGCALPTGAGLAINELNPTKDSSVIVLGLGGIGLSALMALKALGIRTIIAVDINQDKLNMARLLGATHIFNSSAEDFTQQINEIITGGADYCIESAGLTSTIELGFSLIKDAGGKLLFASHPPEGESINLLPHELIKGKKIEGSWGGATVPDRDIPIMFNLFNSLNMPLNSLITQQYSLDEINKALEDLAAGKVFRPLIKMTHDID